MLLGESKKQVLSESFPRKFEASAAPVGEMARVPAFSKVLATAGPTLLLLSSVVLISLHQTLKWDWAAFRIPISFTWGCDFDSGVSSLSV